MHLLRTAFCSAPLILAASAAAASLQQPTPGSPPLSIDRSIVQYQTGPDGALWARGANYKMRMGADGATYLPFLSSSAPLDYHVHFALSDVTVGGAALPLDRAAIPTRNGDEIRFDRGNVDEVYRVAPRDVEQLFVIERLPAQGDLIVRIAVDSDLAASATTDGFDFANEYGRVHYGRATAVDAAGRTLDLESELESGAIAIRVPASFVAGAQLPLVIDPYVSAFSPETGPVNSLSGDVSHSTGNTILCSWEEAYSATDHDVYAIVADENGNLSHGAYVDFTSANWVRPRSAHVTNGDRFLIAAQVGSTTGGARRIWGVVRDTNLGFVTAPFQISGMLSTGDLLDVDVGGSPATASPSYFCVAYERVYSASDRDIHAQLVDQNGVLQGATIFVENTSLTLDSEPSISKSNDARQWIVVWQREQAPGDHDIYAARISANSGALTPSYFVENHHLPDATHPSVSSLVPGTNRYMVAYECDFQGQHDIWLEYMEDEAFGAITFNLSEELYGFQSLKESNPSVDCNGRHFAVSFVQENSPGSLDTGVWIAEILPAAWDITLSEPPVLIGGASSVPDLGPQTVSHESGDATTASTRWWTIYSKRYSVLGGANSDAMWVTGYDGTKGGKIESFCPGTNSLCPCGNGGAAGGGCANSYNPFGGSLGYVGYASTADDTLNLQCVHLPPNKSAMLFQGYSLINAGFGNAFGDGLRCIGAPVFRFPVRSTDGGGSVGWGPQFGDPTISTTGNVALVGGVLCYQVWYRDPAIFCTTANTNFSNALSVHWTP